MTDSRNRAPSGLPTGGQFATSVKAEAEGVRLETDPVDDTPAPTPTEKPCFGCGHQHDPASPGTCWEAACLPGCSGCSEMAIVEANDTAIASITSPEVRAACEEYTTRYALAPTTLDYDPPWTSLSTRPKNARSLVIGDRMDTGQVVTSIEARTGVVWVYCDANTKGHKADYCFNHGDPVSVHEDRADLSDPDWFEVEATRIVRARIRDEEAMTNDDSYRMSPEQREEIRTEARRRLTRCVQSTNISPLFHDGPNADPRTANGRAKIGDQVVYVSPMHGDSAYEVLGKRAQRVILGHDGTSVQWGENGDVEYVLRDIATGHQSTADLRGAGWKRIPAPGDHGPGAEAQRLDR